MPDVGFRGNQGRSPSRVLKRELWFAGAPVRLGDGLGMSIHIGTSGWHYQHWVGPFYPEGFRSEQMLGYCAGEFAAVEINNSFYRLPDYETLATWRDSTPDAFVFAYKAGRYITQMKPRRRRPGKDGGWCPRPQ